jgi:uncharacterized protein (DUF58 family)
MQRNSLAVIILVLLLAAVAVILFLLPPEPPRAEITAVTTDKDRYHSNEVMNITISVHADRTMDNTTLSIEGIQDRFGRMRLSKTLPASLSAGPANITYDFRLPSCSSCAGLLPGTYEINVTLFRNGAVLSNMTQSVKLEK